MITPRYIDPFSRFDDRLMFALFWAVGSAGIVGLKLLGFGQLWVTLFPVGCMLLYLGYIWLTKRFRLREDQAGDNLYYLGLLYTLVSLGFALVLFGRDPENVDDIIANFGIALATTIVGVMLRVMMAQMRQDPVEIEREARVELAQAASQLKDELLQATTALNVFRQATQQSIEEAMREVQKASHTAVTANITAFTRLSDDLARQIGDALGTHAANARKMADASGRTVTALEKLVGRINAVAAPQDLVEAKVAPIVDELDAIVARMRLRSDAEGQRIDAIAAAVEHITRGIGGLDQRLRGLLDSGAAAEGLTGHLRAVGGELDRVVAAMRAVGEATDSTLVTVQRHNDALAAELERSRRATAQVQQALADMARTLADELASERAATAGD